MQKKRSTQPDTWAIYDPATEAKYKVTIHDLLVYDMIAVSGSEEFNELCTLKANQPTVLKMPIIWLGRNFHHDNWEGFETWAQQPESIAAILAARDLR